MDRGIGEDNVCAWSYSSRLSNHTKSKQRREIAKGHKSLETGWKWKWLNRGRKESSTGIFKGKLWKVTTAEKGWEVKHGHPESYEFGRNWDIRATVPATKLAKGGIKAPHTRLKGKKKKTERSKPETVSLPWRGWGQKPKMKTAVIKKSSSQTQVHIRIIWKACFSKTNSWVSPAPFLLILSLKWCLCKDPCILMQVVQVAEFTSTDPGVWRTA